ncbi:MAG: histidine phosphatase family protein [Cyclobacteriaceae bacterium]
MTKTIYLVRHAKSSWKDAALPDYDRPLNRRGKRDAPEMGRRLAQQGVYPDQIVGSPAKRAKKTALAIAEVVGYAAREIQWEKGLYHAEPETLLGYVHEIPNRCQSLMLVGHNPGLTDFYNALCEEEIENIVTAGVVCLTLAVDEWEEIDLDGTGTLAWYDYPKRLTF